MSAEAFAAGIERALRKVEERRLELFYETAARLQESIQSGSVLTGAPGQPVRTGNLKGSWQPIRETPTRILIATNVAYAPAIEDGMGPHGALTLRSEVGGFHSVKLTAANFDKVTRAVVAEIVGDLP